MGDEDGDGKWSEEEILDALMKFVDKKLRSKIMELATKYLYEVTTRVLDQQIHIVFDGLSADIAKATELFVQGITIAYGAAACVMLAPSGICTTTNTFSIFGIDFPPWAVTGIWLGPSEDLRHRIYAKSPVDLTIVDELGRIVNKTLTQIPGATYAEKDLDGNGVIDDLISLPNAVLNYELKVIPEVGASPDDTYTLIVSSGSLGLVIAQDDRVGEISEEGYILQTYDKDYLEAIPPTSEAFPPWIVAVVAVAVIGTSIAAILLWRRRK